MSLQPTGVALQFDAFFTSGRQGKTGLTVTVDVYRGASIIVTAGSATEVGGGFYTYSFASGSNTTVNNYRAVFKTTDTTVDQQWIPALYVVPTWVDTLATLSISSGKVNLQASQSYNNSGSVGSVTGAVGSVTGNVGGSVNSVTTGVTLAASAVQAVWDALTSALTTAGSVGKKLADLILGTDNRVKVSADVHTSGETVAAVTGNVGGSLNGNVAGNVSGSVGSVTGSVGSVTGSVGSVAGNVGGNVAGSVASVAGAVGSVGGGVGGDVAGKVLGGGAGVISGAGVRADQVTGSVGSVTGSVGSVTGAVGGNIGGLATQAKTDTANAVWDEDLATHHTTPGTAGKYLSSAGGASDPWVTPLPGSYADGTAGNIIGNDLAAIRSKTDAWQVSTPVYVIGPVAGSQITLLRGDTLSAALTDLGSISGWSLLWCTVKSSTQDADADAVMQIVLTNPSAPTTDGLHTLNGAVATKTDGSLVVNDASAGDITLALTASASAQIRPFRYVYDIQVLTASGVRTVTAGEFIITGDVTRAVA